MKSRSKILVMGTVLATAFIALGATLTMAAGAPGAGKPLFTSSGCGGCHGLKDAGAKGGSASNFDQTKPGFAAIVAAIGSPPGGMPPNSLSPQQAEDIAAYIVSVAGATPGGGNTGGGDTGGGNTGDNSSSKGKSSTRITIYKSRKIKIKPKKVQAGKITFKIKNKSKRKLKLSLIRISKKKKSHLKLRMKKGRISEKRRVGKKIKLSRSKRTKKVKRKLKTGKYLLIVNQRGNYRKRRYAVLVVTMMMPAYDGTLTTQEIKDVGNYVSTVTGGGYAQPAGRQAGFLKGRLWLLPHLCRRRCQGHVFHKLQ